YFPLDSNMPAIPRNPYSLSKYATEQMLEYFSKSTGMTCIAIRYPWLLGDYYLRIGVERGGFERGNCHDGFAYLPVYSGAEAAICALNADIEGYRCFFVASKDNLEQRSVSEIVGEQLSGVELKKPLDELDSLVDTSVVEKELGWERPQSLAESLEKYGHLEDVRP
ncbi:MAG: NAD-dependent epimerase/dehydratase family protein, partial [Verrucomicrobiota bacterium]